MALRNAQLLKQIQTLGRRNIYILAPAMQKATDPIQQLFVNKIRESKRYVVQTRRQPTPLLTRFHVLAAPK